MVEQGSKGLLKNVGEVAPETLGPVVYKQDNFIVFQNAGNVLLRVCASHDVSDLPDLGGECIVCLYHKEHAK